MRHAKRVKLSTEDVNHALRVRNVERLYGYSTTAPMNFKAVPNNTSLFYLEDDELDFEDILNAPMPKVPLDVVYTGTPV